MRTLMGLLVFGFLSLQSAFAQGSTEDDLTKLISRLIELDSIDLMPLVKHRSGLEPSLHTFDADESGMTPLKDPYSRFGEGKPGATGWYRLSFVVPDKIGKFPVPKSGYNLGIESNVVGSWEIYTYKNGKPAGLWSKDGMNNDPVHRAASTRPPA